MSETLRLFFAALLGFSLLVLFKNWEEWQSRDPVAAAGGEQTISAPATAAESPLAPSENDLPQATQSLATGDITTAAGAPPTPVPNTAGQRITVQTDWLTAVISEVGGNLVDVELKKHLYEGKPLQLIENDTRQYIAHSGLISGGGEDPPNHNTIFRLVGAETAFHAAADTPEVTVRLEAESGAIQLVKTYVFHRADYLISIGLTAKNLRQTPVELFGYFQLAHDGQLPRDYSSLLPTFFGAALYTEDSKFVKISFDDIGSDAYPKKSDNGWIGIIQRYFAALWLPQSEGEREFFMRRRSDGGARLGVILPLGYIEPGDEKTVSSNLFAGAQEQTILQRLNDSGEAPGINLIVDYGWLTFIAVLLFELLSLIHDTVDNWGVAIILLTFAVKLLFYPLSSAAYRSMAKMKEEAPRIKQLQEKYGGDRQRMQQEMMALYREKKINPLGGCLPILIQIPVFIALYWVLLGSVELRAAPFFGWVDDLSVPDPYYILPLLMGVSMFMQTKLSPTPPDPTQEMIMKIMPIGFAIFSIFFPAGLVLYWAVNTLLSIAQQWYITRNIQRSAGKS